jgi:hypothetical protein
MANKQINKSIKNWKMKNLFIGLFVYWVICLLVVLVVFPMKTEASSVSLGVYPPIIQIDTLSPANISTDIQIQNQGEESQDLSIIIKPFKAKGSENGELSYLFASDQFGTDPLMAQRIKIMDGNNQISSITLAPKQEKKLKLVVDIPKGETPSDYYFSIIFASNSPVNNGLSASLNTAGIATNVLLSIGPKAKAEGEIIEFSAPFYLESGPVPLTVRLRNQSDFFITPRGSILIKNVFGQTIGKVDLLPVNILAHSVRSIPGSDQFDAKEFKIDAAAWQEQKALWSEKLLIGPYTANIAIALTEDGPVLRKTIYFVGFPTQAIIGLILIVIFLLIIGKRLQKKIKNSK